MFQSVVTSQPSVPPTLPPFTGTGPYGQVPPSNYAQYMPPRMPYTPLATAQTSLTVDNKSPLPPLQGICNNIEKCSFYSDKMI